MNVANVASGVIIAMGVLPVNSSDFWPLTITYWGYFGFVLLMGIAGGVAVEIYLERIKNNKGKKWTGIGGKIKSSYSSKPA